MCARITKALCLLFLAGAAVSFLQAQDSRRNPGSAGVETPDPSANVQVDLPSPPLRVGCKGNQLTVAANNSTLASILDEVQKCTGVKIDIPGDAAEVRFFDTIGPLPIQDGLSVLLTASGYNFVIQSSDSNPDKVEAVMVMARAASAAPDAVNDRSLTATRRVFLKMRQDALTEAGITDEKGSPAPVETLPAPVTQPPAENSENGPANVASSGATQEAAASPSAATPEPASSSQVSDPASTPSRGKAMEDQITNMEQMFEQRRQMMQTPPTPQH